MLRLQILENRSLVALLCCVHGYIEYVPVLFDFMTSFRIISSLLHHSTCSSEKNMVGIVV